MVSSTSNTLTEKRHSSIYLLPNIFTTAALFFAFYGIIAAIRGRFVFAAAAVFVAMLMDTLDGRIARLTHTQSDFGAQYDSLSDMVAFAMAPALITYLWALDTLGRLGWIGAFFYMICVSLRLARFNTQTQKGQSHGDFVGLPSPAGAGVIMGVVGGMASHHWLVGPGTAIGLWALLLLLSTLMVSTVPYCSFKEQTLQGRVTFMAIFLVVFVFVTIAIKPFFLLSIVFAIYALYAPMRVLYRYLRPLKQP